ncbi:MAG: ATP-binding protein [Streptosporangiaceae bacterium]
MTRRILLVLLTFTAAVLVGAVVPLTLDAASHDRTSFIQATAGMARTDAAIAQSRLDALAQPGTSGSAGGGAAYAPVVILITQTSQAGDGLLIFVGAARDGNRLVDKGMPSGNWVRLATQAEDQGQLAKESGRPVEAVTDITGSRVAAAVPVFLRGKYGLVGTVILVRSTSSLNGDVIRLWVILGTIAAIAMIGAALLAFGLARWVSRPLAGLDAAAGRLADGDLDIRAVVDSGPPELRRLATTFNTMAGRLEALVHGNRAVIADVSHQLRTPLAALRLRLDLLAADPDPDPETTGHELAGALEELARLSRLVDGLLAVARAENVVPVPAAVDVAEVARERVVAWHPVADDRDIVLEAGEAGRDAGRGGGWGTRSPVLAWMGEGHLEQVLDNLIANALDALSAGGHVTVTTTATTAGARISVTDDGPGMRAEDRERAFLRFTTSNPNGTGLGLAIVHRLVTSNGGTAKLTETPGGGLTAILEFPGVPAPANTGPNSTGPNSTGPNNTGAEYPSSAQDLASL